MQIAGREYKFVLVSRFASRIVISSGETPTVAFFTICSKAMIRDISAAGGPTSRIPVVNVPDRLALILTASIDKFTDTASNLIFCASTISQARVRLAVFPARVIAQASANKTSTAFDLAEVV